MSSLRARATLAAVRARVAEAAAAEHADLLQAARAQRAPEELAADAAEEKECSLHDAARSQQLANQRSETRHTQEVERLAQEKAQKAARLAAKRAAAREGMQRLRQDPAFREIEVRTFPYESHVPRPPHNCNFLFCVEPSET